MVSHEGIQLAPHYDLLSTACYETRSFNKAGWPEKTEMAWPILGKQYIADINRPLLIQAGDALSINKATAERLLNEQCNKILVEAENIYTNVLTAKTMRTGELRCLRSIVRVVIKDVASKLKAPLR
jgi:serine/threonine-protein kinase HipA